MAKFEDRVPQNVPGKFYVDWSCIYCGLCDEIAPKVFREFKDRGWAYVFHQPETPEESARVKEAVEGCPTESIGTDGELQDWNLPANNYDLAVSRQITNQKKPWWKFW